MKDYRDEFGPSWLPTAMPSGGNGGLLSSLAEPVEPRDDPQPALFARAAWLPTPPLAFVPPSGFSPALPLAHLVSGKYWPVAPAPSDADEQAPRPASWDTVVPRIEYPDLAKYWGARPTFAGAHPRSPAHGSPVSDAPAWGVVPTDVSANGSESFPRALVPADLSRRSRDAENALAFARFFAPGG